MHKTSANDSESLKIFPVILSGGFGTRLWPMSREAHPKQFLGLNDKDLTLMQEAASRVSNQSEFANPIVVCNQAHRFLVAEQMRKAGIAAPEIVLEPCQRNTGPAIIAAALYIKEKYGDGLMLVLASDHIIMNTDAFIDGVKRARTLAEAGHLVTFGIKPEYAETGYGYIKTGKAVNEKNQSYKVAQFTEKPDAKTAEKFVSSGEYLWNSGMFLFPASLAVSEMRELNHILVNGCEASVMRKTVDSDFIRLDDASYCGVQNISIDYALMEKTSKAGVVALDCGWSDAGSWDSLWRISNKDAKGNVTIGQNYAIDTNGSYIRSEEGPAIATLGVDNLIVVSTKDAVLVANKDRAQDIKALVDQIKSENQPLISNHRRVYRPWGAYDSVDSGTRFQVKRITVKPGQKLSLQMHYHRAEHWIVVSGTAKVVCGDTETIITENESIYIPHSTVHRLENPGKIDLDIIEVQSGSYLGEDDIVRFDDVYGRAPTLKTILENTTKKEPEEQAA